MNRATHHFAPADDLLATAYAVLSGDYTGLPRITESERYDLDLWHREAQATVDGDGRDFARMIERETHWQDYLRGLRAGWLSEDDDFDDYCGEVRPKPVLVGMAGAGL